MVFNFQRWILKSSHLDSYSTSTDNEWCYITEIKQFYTPVQTLTCEHTYKANVYISPQNDSNKLFTHKAQSFLHLLINIRIQRDRWNLKKSLLSQKHWGHTRVQKLWREPTVHVGLYLHTEADEWGTVHEENTYSPSLKLYSYIIYILHYVTCRASRYVI